MNKLLVFISLMILLGCGQKPRIVEEYSNGKIFQRYYVVNDSIKQGELQKFDPNGQVMEISYFKNGQLSGERKLFYPNGSIEVFENYVDGVIHGDYKVYYETGQVKLTSNYTHGVLEGISKKYYPSGSLMEEVSFVNNQENGEFVEYYENGNKKWEGNYLNGDNEFGLLLKYNEEGDLVRKMTCDSLAICRTFWTIEEESDQ